MKKSIIILAAMLAVNVSAKACIAANARTEYMTMFIGVSAVDNSSFNFKNNSLGGKVTLGFGTYKDYGTFAGTFEMYGKGWGSELVASPRDWRVGAQATFNPFASIDRESAVRFRLVGEGGYFSRGGAYANMGARLEFGSGVCKFFIQDAANYNFGSKTWGNIAEVGLLFKFEVGSGKVFCNRR